MIKKVGLLIVALSLCGCGSVTPTVQQIGPYPDNYRSVVKAYMKQTFVDPASIRDVSISAPVAASADFDQGWRVCVQANAKNRLGGYTGLETTAYFFRNGVIAVVYDGQGLCDNVAMTPWPEMTGGGQAVR